MPPPPPPEVSEQERCEWGAWCGRKPEIPVDADGQGRGRGPEAISVPQIRGSEGPKYSGAGKNGVGAANPLAGSVGPALLWELRGPTQTLDNAQVPRQNSGGRWSRPSGKGQVWKRG